MKKIIEQVFRQYTSRKAELNEKGEVRVKSKWEDFFITFPDNSLEYAVVVEYRRNGQKRYESKYRNGQLYGKTSFYSNGQKYWEDEYRNGQLHGKSLGWYDTGQKHWEKEYRNGELVYEKYY